MGSLGDLISLGWIQQNRYAVAVHKLATLARALASSIIQYAVSQGTSWLTGCYGGVFMVVLCWSHFCWCTWIQWIYSYMDYSRQIHKHGTPSTITHQDVSQRLSQDLCERSVEKSQITNWYSIWLRYKSNLPSLASTYGSISHLDQIVYSLSSRNR